MPHSFSAQAFIHLLLTLREDNELLWKQSREKVHFDWRNPRRLCREVAQCRRWLCVQEWEGCTEPGDVKSRSGKGETMSRFSDAPARSCCQPPGWRSALHSLTAWRFAGYLTSALTHCPPFSFESFVSKSFSGPKCTSNVASILLL